MTASQRVFDDVIKQLQQLYKGSHDEDDAKDIVDNLNAAFEKNHLGTEAIMVREEESEEEEPEYRVEIVIDLRDDPRPDSLLALVVELLIQPVYESEEAYLREIENANAMFSVDGFPYVIVPYPKALGYAEPVTFPSNK